MLFGQIVAEAMQLNALGEVVAEEWIKSATIRQEIELDSWIVMPNHLHGILVIKDSGQSAALDHPTPKQPAQRPQRKPHSVGAFIAGFKSAVTRRTNELRQTPAPLWQPNYYDHIIRTEVALNNIRHYIRDNPRRWAADRENPDCLPGQLTIFTDLQASGYNSKHWYTPE